MVGCEGSVRVRDLRGAGGSGGGVAGADCRAGRADRGVGAAAGGLLAQLLQATVGRRAEQAGAQNFTPMPRSLSTAAKHGRRPFDVLTELTSGNVWIPATS